MITPGATVILANSPKLAHIRGTVVSVEDGTAWVRWPYAARTFSALVDVLEVVDPVPA